ncbi:hypothetical protein PV421_44765, partial [Streptomyces scabiei]|nr:hypothetical protein [Streptomyces scabiei]
MRGSPTDRRPTPRPGRARRSALAAAPAVLLLPLLGALCAAAVIGVRLTDGRPRLAVAAAGALAVALA